MSSPTEISVLSAIRRLIRATDADSKRLARQTNLTTSQLLLLDLLAEESPRTVGGIAERIGLAQATVTNMIDRLEEREFVTRQRSDSDRRQVNVLLTSKGAQMHAEAPTALQTRFLKNFSGLQEWEQLSILSALLRVAELMEARDLDAYPVLDVGTIE